MKNEIILRFGIWDFEDVSAEQISDLLGITPNKVYVKGQRKNPKFASLSKRNGWLIDSMVDKYSPFEDQMDSLLSVIEDKIDLFKSLCEKYYCEFSCAIFVYFENGESIPWVHLGTRYNEILKELNIEFDVDLYVLPNDDE